jgi:hypothetical protein
MYYVQCILARLVLISQIYSLKPKIKQKQSDDNSVCMQAGTESGQRLRKWRLVALAHLIDELGCGQGFWEL